MSNISFKNSKHNKIPHHWVTLARMCDNLIIRYEKLGFVILASVWSQTNLVCVYPTSQFPISTLPPTHSNPLSSESFVLQNISWPKSRMRAGPLCTVKMFACARGDFLLCRGLHGLAFYFLFFWGGLHKSRMDMYNISAGGAHSPLVKTSFCLLPSCVTHRDPLRFTSVRGGTMPWIGPL